MSEEEQGEYYFAVAWKKGTKPRLRTDEEWQQLIDLGLAVRVDNLPWVEFQTEEVDGRIQIKSPRSQKS